MFILSSTLIRIEMNDTNIRIYKKVYLKYNVRHWESYVIFTWLNIDTKDDFCLTNESTHLQGKNHEDHTTMSLTTVEAQMWDNIS